MTASIQRSGWLILALMCLTLSTPLTAEDAGPGVDDFGAWQEMSGDSSADTSEIDPWENWNRRVFAFNETVDSWVLRPVAVGYRKVTPNLARQAVGNVFSNLGEIRNFTNSVLQLKLESAVVAVGRFTFNTVFGLGGIFDVATKFDIPERREDFGQTLGHWGLGSGPYLMLPFLGPSNPRDLSGFAMDTLTLPSAYREIDTPERYYVRGLQVVDARARLIPAERFITGDRYTFVRNAYLQRREFLINDGQPVSDPFADDDDLMLEDF